jgi:hypothetical protein
MAVKRALEIPQSDVVPWAKRVRDIGIEHFVLGTDY